MSHVESDALESNIIHLSRALCTTLRAVATEQAAPPAPTAPVTVLLTVEEAAQALNIGRTTMYALIKNGDIRTVRIGRLRRVPHAALNEFITNTEQKVAA